jgi:hypothetical protein
MLIPDLSFKLFVEFFQDLRLFFPSKVIDFFPGYVELRNHVVVWVEAKQSFLVRGI